MIANKDEHEGVVIAVHGNNNYRVQLTMESGDKEILCFLSGNMRRFKINVTLGDKVRVIISPPYDRGRITYREKN